METCEHGNLFHCTLCEIKYLKCVIEEYKKENDELKDKIEEIQFHHMTIHNMALQLMTESQLLILNQELKTLEQLMNKLNP